MIKCFFLSSSVPSFLLSIFIEVTVDILHCVSSMCLKVNQLHVYTYIFKSTLFYIHFPICAFTKYWVEFLVLYSRSLLFIYFIHSSVYVPIPISEPNVCFFGTYACVKLLGSERNRLNCGFLQHWHWKVTMWNLNLLLHLDCQVDLQRTFQEK